LRRKDRNIPVLRKHAQPLTGSRLQSDLLEVGLPKKVVVDLSDEILLRELNRDDNDYRVVFALKNGHSLTKSRVASMLDQYAGSEDHRYYNSVHWLGLGLHHCRNDW
jgi:hypothetical protein